jgi:hypothetical protein
VTHEVAILLFGGAILAVLSYGIVRWVRQGFIGADPGPTPKGWNALIHRQDFRIYRRDDALAFWGTIIIFAGFVAAMGYVLVKQAVFGAPT